MCSDHMLQYLCNGPQPSSSILSRPDPLNGPAWGLNTSYSAHFGGQTQQVHLKTRTNDGEIHSQQDKYVSAYRSSGSTAEKRLNEYDDKSTRTNGESFVRFIHQKHGLL